MERDLELPTHMCAWCGEPWYYDQPVCLNDACGSHDACGHERNYITPMSGLDGLYKRCRRCLAYWHWCHNCEGVDPSTCLFNPTRSTQPGPSSETSPET